MGRRVDDVQKVIGCVPGPVGFVPVSVRRQTKCQLDLFAEARYAG